MNPEDIKQVAKLYIEGAKKQDPPSTFKFDYIINLLRHTKCLVHKTKNKIDGILVFELKRLIFKKIEMTFIYAKTPRKGIGAKLVIALADYAIYNRRKKIYSAVSVDDKTAYSFYDSLGFKKYGKPFYRKKVYKIQKIWADVHKLLNKAK